MKRGNKKCGNDEVVQLVSESLEDEIKKDFRESIVTDLIGPPPPHCHLKPQASFHHLSTIPPTEKKKNAARVWKHCYKNGKLRETQYECLFCPDKPALCVDLCFRLFHQNLGVFPEENLSSAEDE